MFAGLLTMTYAAQDALDEVGLIPKILKRAVLSDPQWALRAWRNRVGERN